jgi:photosystem II stability/assembly factor-like uncharacterized protein
VRLRSLLLVALLAILAVPSAIRAAWVPLGPEGGSIRALAVDPAAPSTLYAGSDGGGVWKSADAAASWSPANAGMGNIQVSALAIDPHDPRTLYAGTEIGVWKSADGGVSWAPASEGLAEPQVVQLALDPLHPGTLYAGTLGGLARSVDGAASWQRVSGPFRSVGLLALDPLHPDTLYAGPMNEPGLFKSTDGGATWSERSAALGRPIFTALAMDPAAPQVVYAATRGPANGQRALVRSADGGATWSTLKSSALAGRAIATLAVAPRSALYAGTEAGLYRSADGARTWRRLGPAGPAGQILSVALAPGAKRSTVVYAGAVDLGVAKSADGGLTFAPANRGLLAVQVLDLALGPGAPATFYTRSVDGQVWSSGDGGASFRLASPLPVVAAQGLAVDPATPSTVYAGLLGRVAKSVQGGSPWLATGDDGGLGRMETQVIAIDPQDPKTLYAVGQPLELRDYTCVSYRSTDAGTSWSCMPALGRIVFDLVIAPKAPRTLYAATASYGVRKSTDRGLTWTTANTGLDDLALSLAVDPQDPETVYASTQSSFWKSVDGGATWARASEGLPVAAPKQLAFFTSIAVDPEDPQILYLTVDLFSHQGDKPRVRVFRSTDGAATWSLASDGLPRVSSSSRLVVDPRHPGVVYLGTYGRGVYRLVP